MSENGKFQLAFWIMATICVGGITFIGNAVIANDRIRANEDAKIAERVSDKFEVFQKENQQAHLAIIGDLREIKTRLGVKNGELNRV